MKNYKTLAEILVNEAYLRGGASVYANGSSITSGFAVGKTNLFTGKMPENRNIEQINEAIKTSKGKAFGSWRDSDNTLYIDVINIIEDRDEALKIAKALNEIAIYDLNKKEEIRLWFSKIIHIKKTQ